MVYGDVIMVKKDSLDEQILKEIDKAKLSPQEASKVLKNFRSIAPKKYNTFKIDIPDNWIRFGVFSDSHIGHQDYRPDVLRAMVKDGEREGVEFWLNCGDTVEGMSGREGHIYELTHIGATAQMDYMTKEFERFKVPVYSIEADSSHGGWFKSKGNAGLMIGEELDSRSKQYKFIGYDEQDIKMDNGLAIRLRHPGGGTAYAISYKMQKYIESMTGGTKPNLLFQGHFHKMNQMFYRNVHGFDAGALQDQSPFMKKMGTPSHLGYWIIDVNMHNQKHKGVERIQSSFIPFYD